MSRRRNKRRPLAEINVVPYIDVMLVLLVIFMMAAPLLHQGVQVTLPSAKAQALPAESTLPVVLSIDAGGQYHLDDGTGAVAIFPEQLQAQVAQLLQQQPKRAVLVRADQTLPYGQIITAMSVLQQGGAQEIGLLSEPLRSEN